MFIVPNDPWSGTGPQPWLKRRKCRNLNLVWIVLKVKAKPNYFVLYEHLFSIICHFGVMTLLFFSEMPNVRC